MKKIITLFVALFATIYLMADSTVDYYLTHPYLFQDTKLTDTGTQHEGKEVYTNADGKIKMGADGWSDFHYDGTSRCIFDDINMSEAGAYVLTLTYRGNTSDAEIIVNGVANFVALDGTSPYTQAIELVAGMNTIKVGKGTWIGVQKIELRKVKPSEAADYYLTHIYYFSDTQLTPNPSGDPGECFNAEGARIKLNSDGYSDFHWNDDLGKSQVIFDGINMSTAGSYLLTVDYRKTTDPGSDAELIVNGVSSFHKLTGGEFKVAVDLNAGVNTIKIGKGCWIGVKSISLKVNTEIADYYLSHTYYFRDTKLTKDESGAENEYFNAEGARIKLNSDGYSDFHWNDDLGKSAAIFDGINMSQAGKYLLSVVYSGTTIGEGRNDVELIVNGVSTNVVFDGTSPFEKTIELVAGMNTIKFGKGCWVGIYSIVLDGPKSSWGTDVENVNVTDDVRKVLIDGQICIIRDGMIYNTLGQSVK